ncbi:MAG: hypothetical protein ABIG37_00525 [Nanoarchaeota archaeon]|nr:hypothetical protein [Nanoarchaeota archaeon]
MEKQDILNALVELRKNKKRKFNQSVDVIINLKKFDIKKESINLFLKLPHKIKDKKIGIFLDKKIENIDCILKSDFDKYKDKKNVKKLVKQYDFFISSASLMPLVATTFGKYLGPVGKMPSPQLGILTEETEKKIKELSEKIDKITRVKSKEPSLKICVGKENMEDEKIAENFLSVYKDILNSLPRKKENLKSIMIKFTMSKPIKIKSKELKSEKETKDGKK